MATKWGIASAGKISHDFVNALSTFGEESHHKVVAVAARSLKDAQDFAQRFGIPQAYEGYEKLASDPDVEVVYVGAIHPAHLEICTLMLNAGKHLLCEKPLAMNYKETKALVDLARSKNLFLMEAVWSRFIPAYVRLREELASQALGDIHSVNVQFGEVITSDRVFKKELGGGSMLDIGIYCVQFACLVFGGEKPLKVVSAGHLNSHGTDESASFTFLYANGRSATMTTQTKVKFNNVASVYGTKGAIHVKAPFWCSDTIETPSGPLHFPFPENAKLAFNFTNSAGLRFEAQHVRECIQKGLTESSVMSLDESLLIAELMEQVRKDIGVTYPQD